MRATGSPEAVTRLRRPGRRALTTVDSCLQRVLRGGSWPSDPGVLRSAYRIGNVTGFRFIIIGFRVARTLDR